jgi:hypothetical protein
VAKKISSDISKLIRPDSANKKSYESKLKRLQDRKSELEKDLENTQSLLQNKEFQKTEEEVKQLEAALRRDREKLKSLDERSDKYKTAILAEDERSAIVGSRQFQTRISKYTSKENLASLSAAPKFTESGRRQAIGLSATVGPTELQERMDLARSSQQSSIEKLSSLSDRIAQKNIEISDLSKEDRAAALNPLLKSVEKEKAKIAQYSAQAGLASHAFTKQREAFGDVEEQFGRISLHKYKDPRTDIRPLREKHQRDLMESYSLSKEANEKISELSNLRGQRAEAEKTGSSKEQLDAFDEKISKAAKSAEALSIRFLTLEKTIKDQESILKSRPDKANDIADRIKSFAYAGARGLDLYADTRKAFTLDRPLADRQNLSTLIGLETRKIEAAYGAAAGDQVAARNLKSFKNSEKFAESVSEEIDSYYNKKLAAEGIRAGGDLVSGGTKVVTSTIKGAAAGAAVSALGSAGTATTGGAILGGITGFATEGADQINSGMLDTTASALQKYAMLDADKERMKLEFQATDMQVQQAFNQVMGQRENIGRNYFLQTGAATQTMGKSSAAAFDRTRQYDYIDKLSQQGISMSEIPGALQAMQFSGTKAFNVESAPLKARQFEKSGLGSMQDFFSLSAGLSKVSKDPGNAVENLRKAIESGSAAGTKAGIAGATEFRDLVEGIAGLSEHMSSFGIDATESIGKAVGFAMEKGTRKDIHETLSRYSGALNRLDKKTTEPIGSALQFSNYYGTGLQAGVSLQTLALTEDKFSAGELTDMLSKLSKEKDMKGKGAKEVVGRLMSKGFTETDISAFDTIDKLRNFLTVTQLGSKSYNALGGLEGILGGGEVIRQFNEAAAGGDKDAIVKSMKEIRKQGLQGTAMLKKFLGDMGMAIPDETALSGAVVSMGGPGGLTPKELAVQLAQRRGDLVGQTSAGFPSTESALVTQQKQLNAEYEKQMADPGIRKGYQTMLDQQATEIKNMAANVADSMKKILASAQEKGVVINTGVVLLNETGNKSSVNYSSLNR